jgi:NADH-quinone oxidoreductase subunit N
VSLVQAVDQVALLPAYLAAGTAVAAFVVDLVVPGRRTAVLVTGALGALATALAAVLVGAGDRRATFCLPGGTLPAGVKVPESCSFVADRTGAVVAVLFAVLTLLVLGLSAATLRPRPPVIPPDGVTVAAGSVPDLSRSATSAPATSGPASSGPAASGSAGSRSGASVAGGGGRDGVRLGAEVPAAGEYVFLLAASMTGGVVLGYARDLIMLLVALETLTLPLYALVALRRRAAAGADAALTFFVVSVVSTAVTLMGAALLYAQTGAVHLDRIAAALRAGVGPHRAPLLSVAVLLVLVGLAFKVAAVPFHGWAPASYDGAPLPVAGYLSTASKLGGVVALLYVAVDALRPRLDVVGPALAVLAVLTMTVGNLVALRQRRMVRLLAWSSVAQAGYLLAPLGAFALAAGRGDGAVAAAVAGTVAYTAFYVLLEIGAFGAVVALRGGADGGTLDDYRGAGRRSPLVGAAFTLALVGLAGLPPGLAGLFAKVAVVRALLAGGAGWLAVVVGLNAVVGLAYYLRVVGILYRPLEPAGPVAAGKVPVPVAVVLVVATAAAVVVGVAPQLVLSAASTAAGLFR